MKSLLYTVQRSLTYLFVLYTISIILLPEKRLSSLHSFIFSQEEQKIGGILFIHDLQKCSYIVRTKFQNIFGYLIQSERNLPAPVIT